MASLNGEHNQSYSIEPRARDLIVQCARLTEMLSRLFSELCLQALGDAHTERSSVFQLGQNQSSQPQNLGSGV